MRKLRSSTISKAIVTLAAFVIIVIRIIWPQINVDLITLGLLAMAALPWLSSWLKALELPGGWKVEFQDVADAGEKIIGSTEAAHQPKQGEKPTPDNDGQDAPAPRPSYLDVAGLDPNLALVGLRIEIERRLRELAEKYGINPKQPLFRLFRDLRDRYILNSSETSGLEELINAGNAAAHGAHVEPNVVSWAMTEGPTILSFLDNKLLTPTSGAISLKSQISSGVEEGQSD